MHASAKGTAVEVGDDYFDEEVMRIEVGQTVTWETKALLTHTVTADDGSFFSGKLRRGKAFSHRFDKPGVFRYHCVYHGAPEGAGMSGIIVVGDAGVADPPAHDPPRPEGPATLRVPLDFPTVQSAVDAARPQDLVLVSPGEYEEAVVVRTPDITIRGTDRHDVILEGGFTRPNGILVSAGGVAIENMTARNYVTNGFYFNGVRDYRVSYASAIRNGDYGIYVIESRGGQLDHVYTSGSPDGGIYIGSCYPCDALVTASLSEFNELGFSGTNAGGNLVIENSEWRNNRSGILPNTLDSEHGAPQREVRIVKNFVHHNGDSRAPFKRLHYPVLGAGIAVVGGERNEIRDNRVHANSSYGILVMPSFDLQAWMSYGNVVKDNVISESGTADLAIAGPSGGGNCFDSNSHESSLPPAIHTVFGCRSKLAAWGGGDFAAGFERLALFARSFSSGLESPDFKTAPFPGAAAQPDMPPDITDGRLASSDEDLIPRQAKTKEEPSLLSLFIGIYAYALPLALYSTWMAISIWDLSRREDMKARSKVLWAFAIIAVPFAGPVIYLLAKSSIQRSLRWFVAVGGLLVYVVMAALAFGGLTL